MSDKPTPITTHRLEFYLTHYQEEELISLAVLRGFQREFPKRAWTQADRRRAITYALRKFSQEPRG